MKTVFFDLGGVLIDFSHTKMCAQLAAVTELSHKTIQDLFFEKNTYDLYEKGLIDSQYIFLKLSQVAQKPLEFDHVMWAIASIFEPIPKTIQLLDDLKHRGTRLILLSNTCEAHFNFARENYPFLNKFDAYLLSYKVALRKPDPKIFRMALEMTTSNPQDCLYVDDVETHTNAAQQEGLPSYLYAGSDALKEILQSKHFLQPA